MLIIKFLVDDKKVTWFVSDNFVMITTFFSTLIIGTIVKIAFRTIKGRVKNSNKKIRMLNPKGGSIDTIVEYIDPEGVYEVVDPALELVIRELLNSPSKFGPVIISVPVLALAHIILHQSITQLRIFGASVFVDQVKLLVTKGLIAFFTALFIVLNPIVICTGLSAPAVVASIALTIALLGTNPECNYFFAKVPMERVSQTKTIGFLESPPVNNPKIYIKPQETIDIFVPDMTKKDSCTTKYQEIDEKTSCPAPEELESTAGAEHQTQAKVSRKCEKQYTPLKVRTKTLADLNKKEVKKNEEELETYMDRYQKRRDRIMRERVKSSYSEDNFCDNYYCVDFEEL